MSIPAFRLVRLARAIARRLYQLYGRQLPSVMPMPPFQNHISRFYQAYARSRQVAASMHPHGGTEWLRTVIPIYGLSSTIIPTVPVRVPFDLDFVYPNPERIPQYLPSYSVGAPRSLRS